MSPFRDGGIFDAGFQTLEEFFQRIGRDDRLKWFEFPESVRVGSLGKGVKYVLQHSERLVVLLCKPQLIDQFHGGMEHQLPVINGIRRFELIELNSECCGQLGGIKRRRLDIRK